MSILKALEKKRTEDPNAVDETAGGEHCSFRQNGRPANAPPELLSNGQDR